MTSVYVKKNAESPHLFAWPLRREVSLVRLIRGAGSAKTSHTQTAADDGQQMDADLRIFAQCRVKIPDGQDERAYRDERGDRDRAGAVVERRRLTKRRPGFHHAKDALHSIWVICAEPRATIEDEDEADATAALAHQRLTHRVLTLAASLAEPGELVFGYPVVRRLCRGPHYAERA